jgi:hypothetical protein
MSETLTSPAGRIRFNPLDASFQRDPYPMYARLREEAPTLRTMGMLVLSRHADVTAALKDRRLSVDLVRASVVRAAARHGVGDVSQAERFVRNSLVFTDNPQHMRLRRLIGQAHTPRMLDRLRPIIVEESRALVDAAVPDGAFDAVERLAQPLPINVLCRWMGVPADASGWIASHVHAIRHLLDPGMVSRTDCIAAVQAVASLTAYFVELIRNTGRTAGDTVIGALCAAQGAEGEQLEDTEVAFAAIMFFVAGAETTQCLIGNLLDALARDRHACTWLKSHPDRIPSAVEESIRHETPLQMTKRIACEPLDINGHAVRSGEQILLCLGAANRDPRVFLDPDTFRLDRTEGAHVGFGTGMHSCLGGNLARLQATILTTLLLERCASIERTSAAPHWLSHSVILRGPATLPLRVTLDPAGPKVQP